MAEATGLLGCIVKVNLLSTNDFIFQRAHVVKYVNVVACTRGKQRKTMRNIIQAYPSAMILEPWLLGGSHEMTAPGPL